MAKRRQDALDNERQSRARRLVRARLRLAGSFLAGGALLAAGCSTDGSVATGDPLLGPGGTRSVATAAAPAPTAPAAGVQVSAPLPRQAAPAALTSNAALANGVPNVPDNGQDLRIAGSYPRPDSTAAGGTGTILQPPQPAGGPATGQLTGTTVAPAVVPAIAAVTAPAAAPAAPPVSQGASSTTFEQTMALLSGYHVTWQRLETLDNGGWKFSCSVPNSQNPAISRTYTGTAADPVAAVYVVLNQMKTGQ